MGKKIYAIGNTHFDPVWLWTLDESMISIRSTFRSALDRMKEYPEFIYSFSCPPVFEWIREVDPALFEEIRSAVRENRWDLCEGWYLQADCNAPGGESLVRQGVIGQNYLLDTFGKMSECVFNSDSFGHSAMMPQILKKCGVEHYVFTRPEEDEEDLPSLLFRWRSRDGSEVNAYRIIAGHKPDVKESLEELNRRLLNGKEDAMLVYGVTDHGGAPTKQCIEELRLQKNVVFSAVADYFHENAARAENVVERELQVRHFGVFVNNPRVKRLNRKAETALLNAEKSSAIAEKYGKKVNWDKIHCAWKDVLFNQFHDIIGGACIEKAYEDVRDMHGRALADCYEILHRNLQFISRRIVAEGEYWNVVLFNLNDTDFDGIAEAEIQWAWEFDFYKGEIQLEDPEGKIISTQIIRERSVIDGFRSRFAFQAKVPAMGYATYRVKKCEEKNCESFSKDRDVFGNAVYEFTIEKNTGEVSVKDKRSGKLYENLYSPCVLEDEGDTWAFNVDGYGQPAGKFLMTSMQVTEYGPYKKQLKTESKFHDSTLVRYFTLYGDSEVFDCSYRVYWREKHKVLKFYVPFGGEEKIVVGVPYGSTERTEKGREFPFTDYISTKEYALICDGVFAYDEGKDAIGLTILRSPIAGDLRLSQLSPDADYDYISNDINEGVIRFVPRGDLQTVLRETGRLLNPLIVADEAKHEGDLKTCDQFFRMEARSVSLRAIKKAERSNATVLRLSEYEGVAQKAVIEGIFGRHELNFQPFEIKTVLIADGQAVECDCLERPVNK